MMRVFDQVSFRTIGRSQNKCGIFMFMQKDSLKTVQVSRREPMTLRNQDPRASIPHILGFMMTVVQGVTDGYKAVIGHHSQD